MFERFTERARRVIFFARYEASTLGNPFIETEHLLLALLREDPILRGYLDPLSKTPGAIRREIEAHQSGHEPISTSVDLPLNTQSKRTLAQADIESKALGHSEIDCGHLVLALLRHESSLPAKLLKKHGIHHETYREVVRKSLVAPRGGIAFAPATHKRLRRRSPLWSDGDEPGKMASSLEGTISRLIEILEIAIARLDSQPEAFGRQKLKRKQWSRVEALGHLIDYATAHHQYFAQALTEPRLFIVSMPQDDWVPAQHYEDCPWNDVLDLWVSLNSLLVHVLEAIPEAKVNMPCRIGIEAPIPLSALVERYVEHCDDLVGQISSRLA